ncbi:ammonium transporter Rh type A-like [Penaeus chinensis]|uniref:ammonium transporter Rh type A-like n=1 Tax=Penaeus chinensis TaxID=139456 RepID=UPI001FB788F8|nr:ammonium transporter Rh type A-like [Penaeus chinensis]
MRLDIVRKIGWFAVYTVFLQMALILMFMGFVRYDSLYDGYIWNSTKVYGHNTPDLNHFYPMFQDIHVMIIIGFGFLMTFLKRYGFSAVSLNLLLSSLTLQVAILVDGIARSRGGYIKLNILTLMDAEFASATVLISFGAVLGKVSATQLVIAVLLEIPAWVVNKYVGVEVLGVVDLGGSILVHVFGAYFGLAMSRALSRRVSPMDHDLEASSYNSDIFSMVGTTFLWVFWPSFNAALGTERGAGRAVINTYLALASAVVAAFVTSAWKNEKNRWEMVHVQNATLAGGVAVGAVADLMLQPWGALMLGFLSGILSTLGYMDLQPLLAKRLGLHDTCGVNNLHGMPGLLSGIVSIGMALLASETSYGKDLYIQYPMMAPTSNTTALLELTEEVPDVSAGSARTSAQQALCQGLALLLSTLIAGASGAVTGFLLTCGSTCESPRQEQLFTDDPWWEVPDADEVMEADRNGRDSGKLFRCHGKRDRLQRDVKVLISLGKMFVCMNMEILKLIMLHASPVQANYLRRRFGQLSGLSTSSENTPAKSVALFTVNVTLYSGLMAPSLPLRNLIAHSLSC